MIPYYSPNLSPSAALRLFGGRSGNPEVLRYFRRLTGKRHILLTSSCRAALYLTYAAMENKGDVLVSPLTCGVAILPMVMTGHAPSYVDIDPDTLNMDAKQLPDCLSTRTRAIQTINLGGNPCEMDKIVAFADQHGLLVVEDCAQGFGSTFEGRPLGSFGAVACFTLSKNAYSIGGGVLATNDECLFQRARAIQEKWPHLARTVLLYRVLRALLESRPRAAWLVRVRDALVRARFLVRPRARVGSATQVSAIQSLLRQPRRGMFRIARRQLDQIDRLHEQRLVIAREIAALCENNGARPQRPVDRRTHHAVCKLFVRANRLSESALVHLAAAGIDAKHLEQKHVATMQERFDRDSLLDSASLDRCHVYKKVHDELLSLPLWESLRGDEIGRIADAVKALCGQPSSAFEGAKSGQSFAGTPANPPSGPSSEVCLEVQP